MQHRMTFASALRLCRGLVTSTARESGCRQRGCRQICRAFPETSWRWRAIRVQPDLGSGGGVPGRQTASHSSGRPRAAPAAGVSGVLADEECDPLCDFRWNVLSLS